jgi:hypothetical protein
MMTHDLIRRMDAVQATRVGPSDEWSRDTKSGYELAATDCMMHILKVPPADLSSPLGAVAMRDVVSAVVAGMAPFYIGETRFADHASLAKQIANIPLPDHAALVAAALALPEVAAMVEVLDRINDKAIMNAGEFARYVCEEISAYRTGAKP